MIRRSFLRVLASVLGCLDFTRALAVSRDDLWEFTFTAEAAHFRRHLGSVPYPWETWRLAWTPSEGIPALYAACMRVKRQFDSLCDRDYDDATGRFRRWTLGTGSLTFRLTAFRGPGVECQVVSGSKRGSVAEAERAWQKLGFDGILRDAHGNTAVLHYDDPYTFDIEFEGVP